MKEVISIAMVLVLAISMFSFFSVGAASASDVGKFNGTIIAGMSASDIPTVRNLIITEYKRGITTRSVKNKGKAYFNYGESTGEYVHAWTGSAKNTVEGTEFYNAAMNQDFTGGNSDTLAVMTQGDNWCCILVTVKSLAKGEAYTVRDGIANAWGKQGATNSDWGMPTDNQRWIQGNYDDYGDGYYAYQTFDWGYAIAYEGQAAAVNFHRYDEENYNPPTGGSLDYDWGVPADQIGEQVTVDIPSVDQNDIPSVTVIGQQPTGDDNTGDTTVTDDTDGTEVTDDTASDETVTSAEGEVTAEESSSTSATSSKTSSSAGTTTTVKNGYYQVGSLILSTAQIVAAICGLVALIIIIVVVIIVLVMKKKKKAAAALSAADGTADTDASATENTDGADGESKTDDQDKSDK